MPALEPVVCALDLHEESESALVSAIELVARAGGPLHLITAQPASGPHTGASEGGVRSVVEAYVDRALGVGACAEIAPRIVVVRGDDPADEIVSYAQGVGAGTLVLGTHGRRGLQRLRLGSVAEEVVRRAECPVLVVPNRGSGWTPGPTRPVLVPVDFSEHSERALGAARTLADLYDAPIETLYVADGVAEVAFPGTARFVVTSPAPPPIAEDVRAFAAEAGLERVCPHTVEGDPANEIVRFADAVDAGAVVMGTHGRRGVSRAVFGSVTEAVIRRLRCPLLAVR